MVSVGIICEGSHDYFYLVEVLDEILSGQGLSNNSFAALQPKVDATSMQIDGGGGGYEAVYQWLISNRQVGLRKYFQPTLFETSELYDIIVVQMDGDVADISHDFIHSGFNYNFLSVSDRVTALKSWISSTAQAEPAYANSIISAIPTLQMEGWIVAGLQPNAQHIEERSRKRAAKRFLRKKFKGNAVEQVKQAGYASRSQINTMRLRSMSFNIFAQDLHLRFP